MKGNTVEWGVNKVGYAPPSLRGAKHCTSMHSYRLCFIIKCQAVPCSRNGYSLWLRSYVVVVRSETLFITSKINATTFRFEIYLIKGKIVDVLI